MSDIRTVLYDLCSRAGLDPDVDIDIGDMHGRFDGVALTSRTSVRSAIEALQSVFAFDVIERDGVVRFVPRGGDPVATLVEDDLVRKDDDGTLVTITRAQEADLPRQVDVTYTSPDNDYQSNTQTARRLYGSTTLIQTVSLPMSLDDDQARQIADRLLYTAWAERESVSFRLGLAHARLDPGDIVTLEIDGSSQRLRLTSVQLNAGMIEVEAVLDDAYVFLSESEGGAAGGKDKTLRVVPVSEPLLLDLPPLREEDDGTSFYAAVSYRGSDSASRWSGAMLQSSRDGGASWQSVGSFSRAATWGECRTVLGDAGSHTWDEANSVEVMLYRGALESYDAASVLNGANAAVIGDEVVQFRSASLIGTDTYRLSGLLRGRRGTEQATGGHQANERFVLLRADDLLRVTGQREQIGVPVLYRAVTYGLFADDQASRSFTNSGRGLKPLAVAHPEGERDATTGDWAIRWTRRARLGGPWINGADVPLQEQEERYEIDVRDGSGNVVRTIATTSPAATYAATEQIADFGAPQSSLRLSLFQISAAIGRGIPREVNL